MERAELVTAALLGTDRRPVATTGGQQDPATLLLDQAARSGLASRAGKILPRLESPAGRPVEHPPWASADAQDIIARLLVRPQADLVNLWLAAAAGQGLGLAPPHWAAVAAYASRNAEVSRELLAAGLGASGRWFVEQNPAWTRLAAALRRPPESSPATSPAAAPTAPVRIIGPDQVQHDPELIFAEADPWPRALVEVALMVVGTQRLQWRTTAYATSLGARMPFEHLPLVRSAAAYFAPADGLAPSRGVRDGFAALDRTLHLRVQIHQAFGGAPLVPDHQESP